MNVINKFRKFYNHKTVFIGLYKGLIWYYILNKNICIKNYDPCKYNNDTKL